MAEWFRKGIGATLIAALVILIGLMLSKLVGMNIENVERLANLVMRLEGVTDWSFAAALNLVVVLLLSLLWIYEDMATTLMKIVVQLFIAIWSAVEGTRINRENIFPQASAGKWLVVPGGIFLLSLAVIRADAMLGS